MTLFWATAPRRELNHHHQRFLSEREPAKQNDSEYGHDHHCKREQRNEPSGRKRLVELRNRNVFGKSGDRL